MDQEKLLMMFYNALVKKRREKDILVNTVSSTLNTDFDLVKNSIIFLLYQTFNKKKFVKVHSDQSKTISNKEKYTLILRILDYIENDSSIMRRTKTALTKKLHKFVEKSSKSVEQNSRISVVDFLFAAKDYHFSQTPSMKKIIENVVKVLMIDRKHNVRKSALKLASVYELNKEVLKAVEEDPMVSNRRLALDYLIKEKKFGMNICEGIMDIDEGVRIKSIEYLKMGGIQPEVIVLKKLFYMLKNDPNDAVKRYVRDYLTEYSHTIGYKAVCDKLNFSGDCGLEISYHESVRSGFFEILAQRPKDLSDLIDHLLPRLVAEKEKIDLSSLFLLRVCFAVQQSKGNTLFEYINKYNLQYELPKLITLYLQNKEDDDVDYYFKLQNILLISFIDVDEETREILIEKYLEICKEIPLHRYKNVENVTHIDDVLAERVFFQEKYEESYFASNEEDIISLVVKIIREIYKYSEHHFLLKLKHDLLDNVIVGAIAEENKDVRISPLEFKIEKTDKKLRENQENAVNYMQSLRNKSKTIIEIHDYESTKVSLENKKTKHLAELSEKFYRGMLIINQILKHAEFSDRINPEFSNIIENFILKGIEKDDLYIKHLSYVSLGFACLLSKELSNLHYGKFLNNICSNYKSISSYSLMFVFDILLARKSSGQDPEDMTKLFDSVIEDQRPNIKTVALEGFCKLLLKNVVEPRLYFITKYFFIYFEIGFSDTLSMITAFFENFIRISEENATEMAHAYLCYLFLTRKNNYKKSSKIDDEKVIKFVMIFDPDRFPNSKNENLHFLMFMFCHRYFEFNRVFFLKIICVLKFEKFEDGLAKFVKNRLDEIKNRFSSSAKDLDKCIGRLPNFKEIVEDISFREYEARIDDIEAQSEKYSRKLSDKE